MTLTPRLASLALTTLALLAAVAPSAAYALPGVPGGVSAAGTPQGGSVGGSVAFTPQRAGGSEYGVQAQASSTRPAVAALRVPRTATAGSPPRVSFQILEAGVGTVAARVTVSALSSHRSIVSAALGWVHTGRNITVKWPAGVTLAPGSYQVSLSAHDHRGASLLREAHSSGVASLTVVAPVEPAATPPTLAAPSLPGPTEAGELTAAETVAVGAVFPVAGPHSFGGPENRFGAGREGHVHQGQDVLSAEGTPELAPMAGRSAARAINPVARATTRSSTRTSASTSCSPTARHPRCS
jgi:hypothetical protein